MQVATARPRTALREKEEGAASLPLLPSAQETRLLACWCRYSDAGENILNRFAFPGEQIIGNPDLRLPAVEFGNHPREPMKRYRAGDRL